jgi:hypothetical protein
MQTQTVSEIYGGDTFRTLLKFRNLESYLNAGSLDVKDMKLTVSFVNWGAPAAVSVSVCIEATSGRIG